MTDNIIYKLNYLGHLFMKHGLEIDPSLLHDYIFDDKHGMSEEEVHLRIENKLLEFKCNNKCK